MFKVEYSKSSRAQCQTCQTKIDKSSLRVGKMVHYEMGRMGFVWNHYACFWGPLYSSGNDWASSVNNWANFGGIDKLSVEDQKMVHLKIKGVPMDDDAVELAERNAEAKKAAELEQMKVEVAEAEEADAAFAESPEVVIYNMINKDLDVMKVADIKEVIKANAIQCSKKPKKADMIKVILDQSVNKISSLAYNSLNKHATADSLKKILKAKGQSCAGTKKDLIVRVLQTCGGGDVPQDMSIAAPPGPALSSKEMGPDEDLLGEEWARLQPYVSVGSKGAVKNLLEQKSVPRHLKIDSNFSIPCEDFKDLMASFGSKLIVIEAGDADSGCRLDPLAAPIIAEHCPRLQKLYLDSCSFSDDDLIRIGYCCPRLRYLSITGNNKCSGNLNAKFLKKFKEDRSFLKKLKILDLTDQSCDFTQLEKMSKARKSVLVRNGESGTDWKSGKSMNMKGGRFQFGRY